MDVAVRMPAAGTLPGEFHFTRFKNPPSPGFLTLEKRRRAARPVRMLAVLAAFFVTMVFPLARANAQESGLQAPPVIIEYDPNAAAGVLPPRRPAPRGSPPAIDTGLQNRILGLAGRVARKRVERQSIPKRYDVPAVFPGEPPRPGTKEFEEFLRQREALR